MEQKLKGEQVNESEGYNRANGVSPESVDSVYEVQGDCTQSSDADCRVTDKIFDSVTQEHRTFNISEMVNDNMHSISCSLQNLHGTLGGKVYYMVKLRLTLLYDLLSCIFTLCTPSSAFRLQCK